MSKLRQTAVGGGKLLSLLSQNTKSRGKIANLAPLAPIANRNNLLAGAFARGVAFGLFVLAFAPLILVTPAHATDDNTVSIAVDQNATLKPTGNLYKATTNVTVKTGKPYGFNLTMQADTADLVNSKDSTHKISATPSSTPVALNANQWGYSLNSKATTFSSVPNRTQPAAMIADVTKAKPAGCTNPANCTKQVTFAASVDPAKLASGSYSTTITYTATAKPAPKPTYTDWPQRKTKTDPSDVCRSGDANSSCLVDLDPNMIPVKYTGTNTNAQWTSLAKPEDEEAKGNWYDYDKQQWANAITVKPEALSKYRGFSKVVDQADILGFWVYIPRYTYEVMRRDGTDKPVKEQNFDIKFENINTLKKRPLACKTGNGKDYRTECGVSRELPLKGGEVSTWTTHPAFTFGTKKLNGRAVSNELNGIWLAKFETTWDWNGSQPTVLPNEARMSGWHTASHDIGRMYTTAKTLGVADSNNIGGNENYLAPAPAQDNHHLAKFSSRMVNNNDWGAAAYLSASKYGAGYNGVQINGQYQDSTYGITGCGPYANGDTSSYGISEYITHSGEAGGTLGAQSACSSSDPQRAYNGTLGQLASTTNNPTGIYDMSGGGMEYVAASYTSDVNLRNSSTSHYFSEPANPPYVNIYNFSDPNNCTFATCGGQALYETNDGGDSGQHQWNGNYVRFVFNLSPWFGRGGIYSYGSSAGLFASNSSDGNYGSGAAFRVALAPAPHD